MPYMLRRRIHTKADLDDDATWKIDLPDSGMVTAFEIAIDCQRFAERDDLSVSHPLVEAVSRVELIAESTRKVISLTGMQQDFLNYIDFKRPNARRHREREYTGNMLNLFLMGGRSLYDREYGFDMSKLRNAFMNYTYDLNEDVAEWFRGGYHNITVYQWVWKGPDAPAFKGYFRSRQVLEYATTGEDALKVLSITPGLPLRRIIVQKLTKGTTLGGTWSEIELEVNNGEYSPVRITNPMAWVMQQVTDYGLQNYQVGAVWLDLANTLGVIPADFAYLMNMAVVGNSPDGATDPLVVGFVSGEPRVQATGAGEVLYRAQGCGYQGCLLIGFDHCDDGFDLLDTAGMSALKLLLTEAAGAKTGAVALQEVELY